MTFSLELAQDMYTATLTIDTPRNFHTEGAITLSESEGCIVKTPLGEFISDDEFLIQDMDVASYYPNLIINNNFYPEHLGPDFIKVLKRLTAERLDAKHKGDKTKADGLKNYY